MAFISRGLTFPTRLEHSPFRPRGLVRGDNTPRSSRVVQASSRQNNEPVVLSSVVRRSPGRLERQLWWDPRTRAWTRGGGGGFFFFFREGCEVMECRGGCVLWEHPNPPPPLPQSFLTPEKANVTELPFAMQIMSRRKEKRSRESMVLYQSADC